MRGPAIHPECCLTQDLDFQSTVQNTLVVSELGYLQQKTMPKAITLNVAKCLLKRVNTTASDCVKISLFFPGMVDRKTVDRHRPEYDREAREGTGTFQRATTPTGRKSARVWARATASTFKVQCSHSLYDSEVATVYTVRLCYTSQQQ